MCLLLLFGTSEDGCAVSSSLLVGAHLLIEHVVRNNVLYINVFYYSNVPVTFLVALKKKQVDLVT